jgi:BirA family transcriptional regulator, biotin operon repressor / biotin---[acetyl-CoA-carboxylase] ligase
MNPIKSSIKIGTPLFVFDTCESTNDLAIQLAEIGYPEGTSVISKHQTRGRGRLGREWLSPDGDNIYFSTILQPQNNLKNLGLLSIIGALSVANTIALFFKGKTELKWPNDILISGRKISGVLLESKIERGKARYVILGIGINLNSDLANFKTELRKNATSLSKTLGARIEREIFLKKLLLNLNRQYAKFQLNDIKGIVVKANSLLYGKKQEAKLNTGNEIVRAVVIKINNNGSLNVLLNNRSKDFFAGEIIK